MNFIRFKDSLIDKIKRLKLLSRKINVKEKISFLDQFSTLLVSGIPITNALEIISFQTNNKSLKSIVSQISIDINKGISLKDCFGKYPNVFKLFDLSIIEMGELTGKIGESMEILKNKEEKMKEIRTKIVGAFIYPSIIISLSLIMIVIFIIYVIPKITDMYSDARVNLPELTRIVIKISDFLQENVIYICIFLVLFILLIYFLKTYRVTKYYFDKFILHIPLVGKLIKKNILAMFTSSLGILLHNGIIINKSLEITAGVVNNDYYKKGINEVIVGVSAGENLSKMMGIDNMEIGKKSFLFPIELASIVKIGEQTGKLSEMLLKISNKYNKEIDEVVKNLSIALEPIIIIGVGIVIGTLIMAIMLPFFNMVNVI
ncbi:MAG: type II secretion system F family protein [Candidatus Gracilibacteria bacterium]|nr:type II secretion system F family protein [Candidatus Gracilibacteria bacterium]